MHIKDRRVRAAYAGVIDKHRWILQRTPKETDMTYANPKALEAEHEALHVQLEQAIQVGGEVGAAASELADRLHEHFAGEERYALPPLALLPALAAGQVEPDMAAYIEIAETLKRDLPQMLAEHQAIVAALEALGAAARRAGRDEVVSFTEKLRLHAQSEEEIMYPAAILVGEFLKLKLGETVP
jgi:hypothetical protein